jgi:hypothetical protein
MNRIRKPEPLAQRFLAVKALRSFLLSDCFIEVTWIDRIESEIDWVCRDVAMISIATSDFTWDQPEQSGAEVEINNQGGYARLSDDRE